MTYKVNDIFTEDNEYSARAQWCNEHGYYISEIEPLNGVRRFQICAPAEPTEEEQALSETEQAMTDTAERIAKIKDELLTAVLLDDTEAQEALKAEYKELIGSDV